MESGGVAPYRAAKRHRTKTQVSLPILSNGARMSSKIPRGAVTTDPSFVKYTL